MFKKLFICFLVLFLTIGCSKKKDKEVVEVEVGVNFDDAEKINNRMLSYGTWESYSPLDPPANSDPVTEVKDDVVNEDIIDSLSGQSYSCNTRTVSMKATPTEFATLNPDVDALWVGSIIQGRGHKLGVGSLSEVPFRERAPMTVSIGLPVSDTSREVVLPNSASVGSAINELINSAQSEIMANNTQIPGVVGFTSQQSHSVTQSALSLGLSASYLGNTIKSNLKTSRSRNQNSVTATFVQRMFTVSMVRPQETSGFFSSDFTYSDYEKMEQAGVIGNDNLPIYVSSITYGRMLYVTFTAEASVDKISTILRLHAEATSSSVDLDFSSEQKNILQNAEIKVYSAGGPFQSAVDIIKSGNLMTYFDNKADLTSAVPISYQIRNISDNTTALVSDITEYKLTECGQTQASRLEALVERMLTGERFFVTMSGAPCTGTIQRGYTYGVEYRGSKQWWAQGHVCDTNDTNTAIYSGAGPESGTFNLWGATFTFDGTGASKLQWGNATMNGEISW